MKEAPKIPPAKKARNRAHGKTRQALLSAGLTLFSERGFDGVAIRDVEEAVGLKPATGSFYRHFSDKEELYGGFRIGLLHAILNECISQARIYSTKCQSASIKNKGDK